VTVLHIKSRDNPLLKRLRALSADATAYRKEGSVWLEGEHLCEAAAQASAARSGVAAAAFELLVFTPDFVEVSGALGQSNKAYAASKTIVIEAPLMATVSSLPSAPKVAALWRLPARGPVQADAPSVVLDGVQDPGNVGSILRSAAAFGFTQVLARPGTAALWAPKVLRAGMGAHFGMNLVEAAADTDLAALRVPMLATSSHLGAWLHQATLPWPCAWVLGHEGQGVSPDVLKLAQTTVRIAQPGGQESLNVAAAAAICLHASSVSGQRS
jgi:RNA methyltransferase, TrmH family